MINQRLANGLKASKPARTVLSAGLGGRSAPFGVFGKTLGQVTQSSWELETSVLTRDLPEVGLKVGDLGAVVRGRGPLLVPNQASHSSRDSLIPVASALLSATVNTRGLGGGGPRLTSETRHSAARSGIGGSSP